MTRTIALGALLLSTLLIAAAYVGALVAAVVPPWTPWALMIGTSTIMLATMVLGASRARGGIGRLAIPFVAMFAVLLVGFGAALVMPIETVSTPLWLGLPPRAAVIRSARKARVPATRLTTPPRDNETRIARAITAAAP